MRSSESWTHIVDPPRTGEHNMQIDEALLDRAETAADPSTVIRFYSWQVPTVSLGKHQRPEEAAGVGYCRRQAIPIVHRPTGGRAVFHAHEITYALISNDSRIFPVGKISDTYHLIARALCRGLNQLGVEVRIFTGRPATQAAEGRKHPCFGSTARHELLFEDRKLAGAAQRQLRRSFLQHGSIPLSVDYDLMAKALGVEPTSLRGSLISVSEAARKDHGIERVRYSLVEGLERTFGVRLTPPVTSESLSLSGSWHRPGRELRPT